MEDKDHSGISPAHVTHNSLFDATAGHTWQPLPNVWFASIVLNTKIKIEVFFTKLKYLAIQVSIINYISIRFMPHSFLSICDLQANSCLRSYSCCAPVSDTTWSASIFERNKQNMLQWCLFLIIKSNKLVLEKNKEFMHALFSMLTCISEFRKKDNKVFEYVQMQIWNLLRECSTPTGVLRSSNTKDIQFSLTFSNVNYSIQISYYRVRSSLLTNVKIIDLSGFLSIKRK